MIDSYHFDKTPEDTQRETPVEDFEDALYAAADAVASTILGVPVAYATVCPGWSESYMPGSERGTLQYEPSTYTFMVSHDDDPTDENTDERVRERMVRDAAIRMACWVALGEDPSEAPYPVSHYDYAADAPYSANRVQSCFSEVFLFAAGFARWHHFGWKGLAHRRGT